MDAPRPIGCQKWPSRSYCMYHTHVNRHQLHPIVLPILPACAFPRDDLMW
jgi:hypothetical protein